MTKLSSGSRVRCHAKQSAHATQRWDFHGQRLVQCHWNSSRRALFSSWTRHIHPGYLRISLDTKLSFMELKHKCKLLSWWKILGRSNFVRFVSLLRYEYCYEFILDNRVSFYSKLSYYSYLVLITFVVQWQAVECLIPSTVRTFRLPYQY